MIASCSGDKDRDASPVGPVAPAAKPAVQPGVSGLGVKVRSDSIVVTWNRAGANVTDYRVQWNKADEEWNTWHDNGGTAYPTETSYTIENLPPGSYKIRVRARIDKKGGPWSSEVVATVPEETTSDSSEEVVVPPPTLIFREDEEDGPPVAALGTVMMDSTALMALYNSTDGANWNHNFTWGSSQPLGIWAGVTTNSDGRVTSLNLLRNNLSGSIPAALGNLPLLVELYLRDNELTGEIPAALGDLGSLRRLILEDNQLNGRIPASLGKLPKLSYLSLVPIDF